MPLIGFGGGREPPSLETEEWGPPAAVIVDVVAGGGGGAGQEVKAVVVAAAAVWRTVLAVLAACSACQGEGSGVAVRSNSHGGRCFDVVVESATEK
jgi:hypothetical protein